MAVNCTDRLGQKKLEDFHLLDWLPLTKYLSVMIPLFSNNVYLFQVERRYFIFFARGSLFCGEDGIEPITG